MQRECLSLFTERFDVCADPYETMEQAISLGIDTILTSGQKNICTAGADLLKDLDRKSAGRITIQVGSGVNADVIRELQPKQEPQRSICPARLLWTVNGIPQRRSEYGASVSQRV